MAFSRDREAAHQTGQAPARAVKRAAGHPRLQFLERVGYVARGVLYMVMGLLALGIALRTGSGQATDLTGSLVFLLGKPFGRVILTLMIVGLAAYALWGIVRAVFDPLHRGKDASGILARLGFVSSAASYAAIAYVGLQLLGGTSGAASGDSTQKTVSSLLAHPMGALITIAVGLIAIGVAIGQFIEAYRATFRHDLKNAEMTETERKATVALGRYGMFARGVTFLIVGWLVLQAGVHKNPGLAHGFGGAFLVLLTQPFGHLLLAVVAVGFVAMGLHSMACARWIRLMGPAG